MTLWAVKERRTSLVSVQSLLQPFDRAISGIPFVLLALQGRRVY